MWEFRRRAGPIPPLLMAVVFAGCGGGGSEEAVSLSEADRAAVESAAMKIARAAAAGDTQTLDALITPGLPQRDKQLLRAGLSALRGKPTLAVKRVEGRSRGRAVVVMEAEGNRRVWQFDRQPDGSWTLSKS